MSGATMKIETARFASPAIKEGLSNADSDLSPQFIKSALLDFLNGSEGFRMFLPNNPFGETLPTKLRILALSLTQAEPKSLLAYVDRVEIVAHSTGFVLNFSSPTKLNKAFLGQLTIEFNLDGEPTEMSRFGIEHQGVFKGLETRKDDKAPGEKGFKNVVREALTLIAANPIVDVGMPTQDTWYNL